MFAIIFLVCMVFFCISYFRYRNLINPYSSFNVLWMFVSLLILIGNRFVYAPNNTSSICVLIGILGFNCSMYSKRLIVGKHSEKQEYRLNLNLVCILSLVVVVMMASDAILAIKDALAGVSFSEIRHGYFKYDTVALYYVNNFFVFPMGYAVISSAIVSIFSNSGSKRKRMFLAINAGLIVFFQALMSGGRYILMNTIFMIVCGYALYKNKKRIQFRYKLLIIFIFVSLGYFIIFLTENRSSFIMGDMSIWQKMYTTIYLYFAGSVTYLGKVLETSPEVISSTLGINLIAGFISPIFAALNFLHILPYPEIFSVIGTKACVQLLIGPNSFYNAMPTIFGYFFIDGGYILTFIESWIFGYASKRSFIGATRKDKMFQTIYLLIFVQVCISSTRWMIYSPEFALAFLYVRLMFKNPSTSTL